MGNTLFNTFFPKTINKHAFGYSKLASFDKNNAIVLIETDDFSKLQDIRQQLLNLPPNKRAIVLPIEEDVMAALKYYTTEKNNKIILSQTELFLFTSYKNLYLLGIKNTKATENRVKLENNNDGYYVAYCNVSILWTTS